MSARSLNATGEKLFPTAPDEAWLALLDTAYSFGFEIVGALGGSRSKGARTRAFRAFYLEPGGGRRGPCVIKLGHSEPVQRDYQGWFDFARRQPNRNSFSKMDPPVTATFGAILITDFVGTEEAGLRSLADETSAGFPLLSEAVARVTCDTLRPLHECLRPRGGDVPHLALTQAAALRNWTGSKSVTAARERLNADPATRGVWAAADAEDAEYSVCLHNHLPEILSGKTLPNGDAEIRLPLGAVHGDPNFDNIFVAHTGSPAKELTGVALIDFEWCREGPPESPYDDLANIECELLFGNQVPHHRRELSLAIALGDPRLRDERPLSTAEEPDRGVYEAIRTVRARVAELAELAGGDTPELHDAFLRGYLVTLLGQALRYLGYDVPGDGTRAEILHVCQLLAARLAAVAAEELIPPFSSRITPSVRKHGTVSKEHGFYVLEATDVGAYAGLVLHEPAPAEDFLAICDLELLKITSAGWIGFAVGVQLDAPERSGLSAMLHSGGDSLAHASVLSHTDSRHNGRGSAVGTLTEILERQLVVRLTRDSSALMFTVEGGGSLARASVDVAIPPQAYRGPLAIVAHGATVRVSSLRLELAEPAIAVLSR